MAFLKFPRTPSPTPSARCICRAAGCRLTPMLPMRCWRQTPACCWNARACAWVMAFTPMGAGAGTDWFTRMGSTPRWTQPACRYTIGGCPRPGTFLFESGPSVTQHGLAHARQVDAGHEPGEPAYPAGAQISKPHTNPVRQHQRSGRQNDLIDGGCCRRQPAVPRRRCIRRAAGCLLECEWQDWCWTEPG